MPGAGNQNIAVKNNEALHTVYDKYAGMLFGYLLGVLKDRQLAESHLISIFPSWRTNRVK